ncbi:hypothetical protein SB85_04710 [Xanthomonas sacchari]|nr:hypothetical protein SB85_04710 [Xanthomonas sacchari]
MAGRRGYRPCRHADSRCSGLPPWRPWRMPEATTWPAPRQRQSATGGHRLAPGGRAPTPIQNATGLCCTPVMVAGQSPPARPGSRRSAGRGSAALQTER